MRLIDESWKPGHILSRDPELFRWQYPLRPDGAHSILVLHDDSGRPAGVLGVIPVELNVRGHCRPGAMLALWFVRAGFADRSAGLRLLQHLFAEGYAFIGVLGIGAGAVPIYQALRFHVVPRIERWVRCYDPAGLELLLSANPQPYPGDTISYWTSRPASAPAEDDYELSDWNPELARDWDFAWRERFAPQMVGVARTADYLERRYVRHPRFHYVVRFARRRTSRKIAGLAAYRIAPIRDRPQRVLRIVDFLATDGAGPALVAELDRAARREQATFADFYCTSDRFAEALRCGGYAPESASPAPLPSLFQPLDFGRSSLNGAFYLYSAADAGTASLFAAADIYFTRGDGDQDRPS
jgi:hypothetical protein